MRYLNLITLSVILFLSGIMTSRESSPGNHGGSEVQTTAQEKAANLRSQLSEVEARQAELQTRLQNLEENLKSENIEHSLAGVGSTHPEDLREQRRRQLEIERNGVQAQLNLLAVSHSRLETAIAQADAEAYRQSAAPVTANTSRASGASAGGPSSEPTNEATTPARQRRVRKKKTRRLRRANHTGGKSLLNRERVGSSASSKALTLALPDSSIFYELARLASLACYADLRIITHNHFVSKRQGPPRSLFPNQ